MIFESATLSLAGNAHPGQTDANWDAAACLPSLDTRETPDGLDLLAAVADGVSATPQGGRAARAAVRAVRRWVPKAFADVPTERLSRFADRDFDDLLANAVRRTHDTVAQQVPEGHTTLALACVRGERLLCANLGDTRILLWRDGELRQLSEDHHSGQGITRWVGGAHVEPAPALRVDERVLPGDVLLLCSDGFYGLYSEAELRDLARWLSRAALPEVLPRLSDDLQGRMASRNDSGEHVDDASTVLICAREEPPGRSGEREHGRNAEREGGRSGERERERSGEREHDRNAEREGSRTGEREDGRTGERESSGPAAQQAPRTLKQMLADDAQSGAAGKGEADVIETQENPRMAAALEELAAAVRLLRTQLAPDPQGMRERRRSEARGVERWVLLLAVPGALLLGLALGLAGGAAGRARRAPAPTASLKPKDFALKVAPPVDLGTVVDEGIEGETYRLTYIARDRKSRRTLCYWLRSRGENVEPYGKVIVPLVPAAAVAEGQP